MKYIIDNNNNQLVIINDSRNVIFGINKFNKWIKYDFDQYGTQIYNNSNYTINDFQVNP